MGNGGWGASASDIVRAVVGSRLADVLLVVDVKAEASVVLAASEAVSETISDLESETVSDLEIDGGLGGSSIIGLGICFLGVTISLSQFAKIPTAAMGFGLFLFWVGVTGASKTVEDSLGVFASALG